jgi:hypothetical protein
MTEGRKTTCTLRKRLHLLGVDLMLLLPHGLPSSSSLTRERRVVSHHENQRCRRILSKSQTWLI